MDSTSSLRNYTIHVLVVDDDPQQIRLYKHYLDNPQYKTDAVTSGKQALNVLKNHPFDIILIDMQMPEMSGSTILGKIKQELKLSTPVIMATAHGESDATMHTIELGAYDILQKPFSTNRLKLTIRNAYRFKRLWDNYTRLRKVYEKSK